MTVTAWGFFGLVAAEMVVLAGRTLVYALWPAYRSRRRVGAHRRGRQTSVRPCVGVFT